MPQRPVRLTTPISVNKLASLLFPAVVLVASLTATSFLWYSSYQENRHLAELQIEEDAQEITNQILKRLEENEDILTGGNALFSVRGDALTRHEWSKYASSLKLNVNNPGILGFGFSAWVPKAQKNTHISTIRGEGFVDYTLSPAGERDFYSPIVWIEPFDAINQRALGYDMYATPVRRLAMDRARETGLTSISEKVILVQDLGFDVQTGVLMYIPSYRSGMPTVTVEQRCSALRGFVYSPIRMNDFIHAALPSIPERIDFTIYSGQNPVPENILYYTGHIKHRVTPQDYQPQFLTSKTINVFGATWHLTFSSLPALDEQFSYKKSYLLLCIGIVASLLLSVVALIQAQSRRQALIIARQSQEELITQQKFALHIQQTPLAVIEWDAQLIVTEWNQAAEKIFGYPATEAIGSPIAFIFSKSERQKIESELLTILQKGQTRRSSYKNKTQKGLTVDCEWYSTALVDHKGIVIGVIALVQDVTEQKKAAEKLLAERNTLQSVMNGAINSHLIYLDRNFNFIQVNETYAATCGYRPEEMIGKNHFALYPDAENEALFAKVRDTGEPIAVHDKAFEFPDQPERGVTWWDWALCPVKNLTGEVIGLVFSLFETTERKKTEMALKDSETRFRCLFEQHSAIMLQINPANGDILNANEAAAEFYGYPRDILCTMNLGAINCLSREQIATIIRRISERQLTHFASPHRLADGTIRTVEVYATPISIKNQEINFAIIHDITDRVQAEADREWLEAQNRQLQKSESLSRMAGAIAHHMNNQLQAVMMSLEMIQEISTGAADSSMIMPLVATAIKSTGQTAEVSRLLLTYLGQTPVTLEPLDISDVCRNYQPLLMASMPNNVEMKILLPQSGPVVNSNVSHLQQIINNLVTNAWEACEKKSGTVTLRLHTIAKENLPGVYCHPIDYQPIAKEYACIEVADTGGGILKENFDQLFDPFYSSKFTGRGMGLSVVLGIVRAHKGAIALESELGQGSTFRVYLPVTEEVCVPKSQIISFSQPNVGNGAVLIVEDSEIIRKMLTVMLESIGYTIFEAEDGLQAIEIFKQHQDEIVCVISDVVMPNMNGWETLKELRRLSPGLPVILASGYTEAQIKEGCHEEQPQAFLEKPFSLLKLRDTLAQILNNTMGK